MRDILIVGAILLASSLAGLGSVTASVWAVTLGFLLALGAFIAWLVKGRFGTRPPDGENRPTTNPSDFG